MKILVVDGNDETRLILEDLLRSNGHEVVGTSDGSDALKKLLSDSFDAAVSEVVIPKVDGLKLCQKLKSNKRLKRCAFIFYTDIFDDPEDEKFVKSLGADAFIAKLKEPEFLLNTIEEVSKRYKLGETKPLCSKAMEGPYHPKEFSERLLRRMEDRILHLEKMNKELMESERRYKDLISIASDAIVVLEPTGYFSFVNAKFCERTGYSMEEVKKLHFSKFIHPDDLPIVFGNFKRRMAGKEAPKNYEFRALSRSKEVIYVDVNAAALKRGDKIVGALTIIRDITKRKHAEERLQKTFKMLKKVIEGSIQAMALITEVRDPYTAGHQERVAGLAHAIASEMGLSEEKREAIRLAGLVHDIGKISVPSEILSKPGRITDIEFSMIKIHPKVGYEILKTIEFPWPIAKIVKEHHERVDGSGYPEGISGENILIEARIIGIADVVEAMASHRPYRPALGIDRAMREISRNRGILYDPYVVDVCLHLLNRKGFSFWTSKSPKLVNMDSEKAIFFKEQIV